MHPRCLHHACSAGLSSNVWILNINNMYLRIRNIHIQYTCTFTVHIQYTYIRITSTISFYCWSLYMFFIARTIFSGCLDQAFWWQHWVDLKMNPFASPLFPNFPFLLSPTSSPPPPLSLILASSQNHAHTHTQAHTHIHTQAQTHTQTHAHAHTHACFKCCLPDGSYASGATMCDFDAMTKGYCRAGGACENIINILVTVILY